MSLSATGISRMVVPLRSPPPPIGVSAVRLPDLRSSGGVGGLAIECSSRPKKKGTAHHNKTRPKKSQPWDIRRRGPTFYPPLPPLPPDWTVVTEQNSVAAASEPPVAE
ncbi:unnamed protein product [Cuscuta campestris]|uniref:50S ribosomal protein 6, chloroplastic n=1 Tax=Cuscuta campestris TaxID=132261 RepID=A0A484MD35_9ASTE|nr:unnamed protein product [Cuscuta campestris]